MKPINVEDVGMHDTNSSELSASTASNSTLPQLEASDAKKAQNEEERRRRVARKEKREAREKEEEQRLEEKKARKDERRLKREARRKRREARKKKEQEAKASMHLQVSYLAAPKMVMMMSPTKCIARRTRKERARRMTTINMSPYPLTILLCL